MQKCFTYLKPVDIRHKYKKIHCFRALDQLNSFYVMHVYNTCVFTRASKQYVFPSFCLYHTKCFLKYQAYSTLTCFTTKFHQIKMHKNIF